MFVKQAIRLAFNAIISLLIAKINPSPLRDFLEQQILPAQKVAELLFDSNPNNAEQLKEFWEDYQLNLKHYSIDFVIKIVEQKVESPFERELIITILRSLDENGQLIQESQNTRFILPSELK
jgi:hypothetical protein